MDFEEFGRKFLDWTIEGIVLTIGFLIIGNGLHIIPVSIGVTFGGSMDLRTAIWIFFMFPILGFIAEKVQHIELFSNKRGTPD